MRSAEGGPPSIPDVALPFGYIVRVRFVHRRWALAHGYGRYGGWSDFRRKIGTVYVCKTDPLDEQLDTLQHELGHALTDWTGQVRRMQRRVQREMRKTAVVVAAQEGAA